MVNQVLFQIWVVAQVLHVEIASILQLGEVQVFIGLVLEIKFIKGVCKLILTDHLLMVKLDVF